MMLMMMMSNTLIPYVKVADFAYSLRIVATKTTDECIMRVLNVCVRACVCVTHIRISLNDFAQQIFSFHFSEAFSAKFAPVLVIALLTNTWNTLSRSFTI